MSVFPNCDPRFEKRVKRQLVGKPQLFLAIVQPGFEQTAVCELEGISGVTVKGRVTGGVEFSAKLDVCYTIHLVCRTVNRVIMRIASFNVLNMKQFVNKVKDIPWELYLAEGTSVSYTITARKSWLYHTGKISEGFDKGLSQRIAELGLARPPVNKTEGPGNQDIYIRIEHDKCLVSLDCSGETLYKRGQRRFVSSASIRETTAAAILREACFDKYGFLIDGMCGAGTFSLEAAEMMLGKIPASDRKFSFMLWPSFRPAVLQHLKQKVTGQIMDSLNGMTIIASDIDEKALETAQKNFAAAGIIGHISLEQRDFFSGKPVFESDSTSLLVLNPPYGKRSKTDNVLTLFKRIGQTIKNQYPPSGYAIIVPGIECEHALSLPYDRKILFMNGGVRVALIIKDAY